MIELGISICLAGLVVLIHYETLRLTSISLPHLKMPPRQRILVVICAAFVAHVIEITLYAASYMVLERLIGTGNIAGLPTTSFYDYFYYSMVTYTTLGIGDLYPLEGLRLLTGMESLVGLMMITWTASFTYLSMEKFWKLH
ncbi:ion channel [Pseudomonadota bacterium]